MNALLEQWISELTEELVIAQSQEINKEAINNMVAYGMPEETAKEYGSNELSEFLSVHLETYRSKANGNPMVAYAWFDEQAGQLRMSAVSQKHGKLPFGCKIQQCDLPTVVETVVSRDSGLFNEDGALKVWVENI